ncbi:hypothetical protein FKZ61_002585 [Litorilinea aerophila]|uniref:Uncharacterized protein n=1 Tax=Litorilinea aerophila TaxID=1204385 RepID=A0A540VKS3_9CHLR|nr:hypothetical protein [Litorilinea aerophila]MCC9075000.1 hypothetical protein [Litorilinea aerophila]
MILIVGNVFLIALEVEHDYAPYIFSFALLAYLEDETGVAQVEAWLVQAEKGEVPVLFSPINLIPIEWLPQRP